jgi:hypothetical protein
MIRVERETERETERERQREREGQRERECVAQQAFELQFLSQQEYFVARLS